MENKELSNSPQASFDIPVSSLKEIVNKWMQREHGSDDIDFVEENGGESWLETGLRTDFKNGITEGSVESRERFFGSNRKEKLRVKTLWELVLEASDDLILIILIFAGIASIIINMVTEEEERGTAWIEGFAILLAVVIVVLVTAVNDLKKEREFQKLNEEAESGKKVSVIRQGIDNDDLKIENIVVGDIVFLKAGIEIPGDGVMVDGFDIQVDESSMTGETKPMKKEKLEKCLKKKMELEKKGIEKIDHHEIPSIVLMAGTKVVAGTGRMVVVNVGINSSIGKIQEIVDGGEEELTPLQMKLEKIARDIGYFGLISAVLIFIVLVIRLLISGPGDEIIHVNGVRVRHQKEGAGEYVKSILEYFMLAITILVVAIPEGLPLAVTLSLAFSVNKMMEDKNLVRKLQACETMGGANIICSDKTGTLTRNEMYLTHFYNGKERQIFDPETDIATKHVSYITNEQAADIFVNTIILNSVEDPRKIEGNPTEMAILKYIQACDFSVVEYRNKYEKVFQASFSSDRKRMSTLIKMPDGKHILYMKGASEYMIRVSDKIIEFDSGKIIDLTGQISEDWNQAVVHMATGALRTIGICYKEVDMGSIDLEDRDDAGIYHFEKDGFTMVGICGIKDIIRKEVPESIRQCARAGISVKMVTGDNIITATAIAKEIGIITQENESTALILEGPDFLRQIGGVICANCRENEGNRCDCVKNDTELQKPENKGKKIRKDTILNQGAFDAIWKNLCVLARSRPEDKYALVVGLKEKGNVVAVTGDGTNDAPALSKADVGFAMGIAGTEVAKQAADILIMDDNFASIVSAVKWGRNIYDSIRKFLVFQLTVNIVAVITTFVAAVILQEAILSAVQMLWINLIMDTLAALALATEPPTDALLNRHPHGRNDYIVSPIMMKHILGQSVFQSIIMFIVVFIGEDFLFDIMAERQIRPGHKYLIVNGRTNDGFLRADHNDQYSVHYTYIFNIFVFLQFFNFFNARVLDNTLNVFKGITKSTYLIVILIIIFFLQVIFLTFAGPAIRVIMWGLDPISWGLCIAIGLTGLIWSLVIKFIPLEKYLPGGGSKEISKEELNRTSTMNLRKKHDSNFYRQQSGIRKKSSMIEDRSLN